MNKIKYWSLCISLFCIMAVFAYQKQSIQDGFRNVMLFSTEEISPKSSCSPFSLPFKESFNSDSSSIDCWTIVDGNGDSSSPTGSNIWKTISYSTHEGNGTMYFYGSGKPNDDWLISPTFSLNGGLYELSYFYRTNTYDKNEFEVYYSTNGVDVSDFTEVIYPKKMVQLGDYVKATYYFENITGSVNIGWHVVTNGDTSLYVDEISLEEVSCKAPDLGVKISNIGSDKATASWQDDYNSKWEYHLLEEDEVLPTKSGAVASGKSISLLKTTGASSLNLLPNTPYDFYVRSSCGVNKFSKWIGPIKFRTSCVDFNLPFVEGFNKDSSSISCWSTPNVNSDGTLISDIWKVNSDRFEGDQSMRYYGSGSNDAWLISPGLVFDSNKTYRVSYKYKTSVSFKNDYRVLLSKSGAAISAFTEVLLERKQLNNESWIEEKIIINGISGSVNLAWHANTMNSSTYIFIDDLKIEEVACADATDLVITNATKNAVNIDWKDGFGSEWEYVVNVKGTGVPAGSGIKTTSKSVVADKDTKGNVLQSNTAYEVYVRSVCSNGEFSDWTGPVSFRTLCEDFSLPFWEGFNGDSESFYCWSTLDENKDGTTGGNQWLRVTSDYYEGSGAMRLSVYDYSNVVNTDDYLVSPTLVFSKNKIYRLRYFYKGSSYSGLNNVEVLASSKGVKAENFDKEIVKIKSYTNDDYLEEIVFIKNLEGAANLAWHVKGLGNQSVYIDNISIEEVEGCPEPLNPEVKDIEKDKATLVWSDDMGGSSWEFFIQEAGLGMPTSNGVVSKSKTVTVTSENSGKSLIPNTKYDFYVRTVCGKGAFSVWTKAVSFYTACTTYSLPFEETFNSLSKSTRCWTVFDENGDTSSWGTNFWKIDNSHVYEGDLALNFAGNGEPNNDWAISPGLELESSQYVLKYQYRSDSKYENSFEVLLSYDGADVSKFTTELVKGKVYKNDNYIEEVVFFTATKGIANIAWHLTTNGVTTVSIDNISLKEVSGCLEPYLIEVSNPTDTSLDLKWQQLGGLTDWEILVVPYGEDENASPILKTTVSGTPNTTLSGLPSGTAFTIYVRAACGTVNSFSDWATAVHTGTLVGGNDECSNATVIPVNKDEVCNLVLASSFNGATISTGIVPATCAFSMKEDVWYSFTATSALHLLSLTDVMSFSGQDNIGYEINGALYSETCGNITGAAKDCFVFRSDKQNWILRDLIPGNSYTVRLGSNSIKADFYFNLCITGSEYSPLEVSSVDDDYSLENLVKKVLIDSECDIVDNIYYQVGDGSAETKLVNAIGSFKQANSLFPFESGIVLATNDIDFVSGPYRGDIGVNRGAITFRWNGDKEINDLIKNAGGGPSEDKRVTQLGFDFIPLHDELSFEYLFASNSYSKDCGHSCEAGAMFGAWLIDSETGEAQNLAKVKGTDKTIALNTVRDSEKLGLSCESSNAEYFWKSYGNMFDNPIQAPIDFAGMTKAMQSEKVKVVPGRRYHIKLTVMDFCAVPQHSSAVFFNAGSFDIGNIDLGADLLVDTENAICYGESQVIHSGLVEDVDNLVIEWFKNGVLIPGETNVSLEVTEAGTYMVKAFYKDLNCGPEGSIVVEFYAPLTDVVNGPKDIEVCRFAFSDVAIDLFEATLNMFPNGDSIAYDLSFFLDDALTVDVKNPSQFVLSEIRESQKIYLVVTDKVSGCSILYDFILKPIKGAVPDKIKNVVACESYELPALAEGLSYFSESGGKGKRYNAGDILDAGVYIMFVVQDNGNGCFEETSFTIEVSEGITADYFEDQVLNCKLYELLPLSANNKYFTVVNGNRVELPVGSIIYQNNTEIIVVATSSNGACSDEHSFTINYEECPIQKGISPNGDGLNDSFDLSAHGVTSVKVYNRFGSEVYSFSGAYTDQWKGTSKSGGDLPSGTYYYVVETFGQTKTGWVQINR